MLDRLDLGTKRTRPVYGQIGECHSMKARLTRKGRCDFGHDAQLKDAGFPSSNRQQVGEIGILNSRTNSDIPTNGAELRCGDGGWRIKTIQFHFCARFKSRRVRQDQFCRVSHSFFTMATPKGPFRLVTVNTAPERAQRLIGRVADTLKDRYIIIHEANCSSM